MSVNEFELLNSPQDNVAIQVELAKALKRKQNFGQLAQLTGDRVLAPFGQGLVRQADQYAQQSEESRRASVDDKRTAKYQDAQIQQMGGVLAESIRNSKQDDATARRGQDLAYQSALLATMGRLGGKTPPRLTGQDKRNLEALSSDISAIEDLESFIDSGKGFGAVKVGGIPIPYVRALKNTAASYGFGDADTKAAFKAKQDFDRLYTLAARNRLYGATLTKNEQRSWDNANPSIRQTDEQIKDALSAMKKVLAAKFAANREALITEGYNSNAIDAYSGLQRGKENPRATDDELTAEEMAELEERRKLAAQDE